MTTRPRFDPLDRTVPTELVDMATARVQGIPREQHGLMSSFGGPPKSRSCYYAASAGTPAAFTLSECVPPGVTEMDIEIDVSGDGSVAFTTSVDATGSLLRSAASLDVSTGNPSPDYSTRTRTGGVVDAANGPSGRALTVRSSAVWSFDRINVTVTLTPETGRDLEVYGITFYPVHIPR